jgi:gingipain R
MLIICYDAFSTAMQPFVDWKNQKGIATELVTKSIAGADATSIKAYIATYYATHPNLKYVLLVGDAPQIPASTTIYGDSDNDYGYLTGDDSYPELFVGRFSATTPTQVQIMVNRTINYEKTPLAGGTWYKKGITIGSALGPGDNNEYDFEHERIIRNKLLGYTYNDVSENYDGAQGGVDLVGDPTSAMIAAQINDGVGVITYTGHGADNEFVTSNFSTIAVHALTNTDKFPFIWSVACVNGDFVNNSECFAEAWLRQGTPAQPKGAIGALMATINQSWNPPMKGQDAMIDILVESVSGNIQRTFGGLSMNGCMEMNDAYQADGNEMTDTWNLFGDPSVMVYTNTPAPMAVNHISTTPVGTTSITVNCNVDGALICLSMNGILLGTGVSNGTSAILTIPAAIAGVIDVTATAFNKMPYTGTINVGAITGIVENANEYLFTAYPVPASNILNLSFKLMQPEQVKIALYNNLGQQTMFITNEQFVTGTVTKTIDVSTLPRGVYFCKFETSHSVITKCVIVNN